MLCKSQLIRLDFYLVTDASPTSELASQLRADVGLLVRRLRQAHVAGELSLSEASALARIERDGPMTSAELARAERISPQSMGVTLRGLQERGLLVRAADPGDGRRLLLSVSEAGRDLRARRKTETAARLAEVLESELSSEELEQLQRVVPLLRRVAEGL